MGVTIRAAGPHDREPLAMLIGQLGYAVTPEAVAGRLATMPEQGFRIFVAEEDGTPAGCITTSIMHVLHRPTPVGRISMLVVSEDLRGRGIGAALVRQAEEVLAAQGCALVEVTSNLRLTEAHRFYARLGYLRTSVRLARDLDDPAE